MNDLSLPNGPSRAKNLSLFPITAKTGLSHISPPSPEGALDFGQFLSEGKFFLRRFLGEDKIVTTFITEFATRLVRMTA